MAHLHSTSSELRMRFLLLLPRLCLVVALLASPARLLSQSTPAAPSTGTTTVVLVRHAEKATDDPRDPSLSPAGQERAQALLSVLRNAGVTAIYATQYRRPQQTAAPLAQQLGLSIVERPATAANASTYARDLAQEIISTHAGKTVLVAGHSNTVPEIVEALSGSSVQPISESEYDHLFLVVVPASGPARLFQVRYGRVGA